MGWTGHLLDWYSGLSFNLTWTEVILYLVIFLLTRWAYMNLIQPFLSPLRKFPGKPYLPLVGNMLEATRAEAMSNAVRWTKELDTLTLRFYFFNGQERLLTADPQVFRHVLITNASNYIRTTPRSGFDLFKKALFFLSGQQHHQVRKLLNPAFGMKVLNEMVPVFDKKARKMTEIWQTTIKDAGSDGWVIPVQDYMTRLTLDSICDIGMDFQPDSINNPDSTEVKTFSRVLKGFSLPGILAGILPFFFRLPFKANKARWRDEAFVKKLVMDSIQTKRRKFAENEQITATGSSQPRDFLSLLVLAKDEDGSSVPEETILTNVTGLMFAGFDTTSTALTWTLLKLAEYPDVQQKARDEICSVIPDQNAPLTSEILDKLHYLTCVVKETLRLYPSVSSLVRVALKDDVINGCRVPAGTNIICHIGALHRSEKNWENAETFNPDRFLDKEHEPYKWLPFITGPYMCIGHKFAMLEVKTVLTVILQNFEFSLAPGYKYRRIQALSVKPHPPLQLMVKKYGRGG